MKLWLDAQLSPSISQWMSETFSLWVTPIRDLGLRDASDRDIFFAAREAVATVITKDIDFVHLLTHHGPPPKVIWLTCGNTSNDRLRVIFEKALLRAIACLESGDNLVEILG
ncbi:MAG: DUF5615 family PIN-like protein [Chlamydiae bacterium]|nr:DUF5615 family PIN-like protein [Chlamydiota bacterium]MBI3266519.1 DUF5615 family PIN-like protein [Chlamydiota bacterium]